MLRNTYTLFKSEQLLFLKIITSCLKVIFWIHYLNINGLASVPVRCLSHTEGKITNVHGDRYFAMKTIFCLFLFSIKTKTVILNHSTYLKIQPHCRQTGHSGSCRVMKIVILRTHSFYNFLEIISFFSRIQYSIKKH